MGIEFSKDKEIIGVTFAPVAIDGKGQIPADNRVQFVFKPVGRFIASYRLGNWDDEKAEIVKFKPEDIFEKVEEFKHQPIYGWKFIDCGEKSFDSWKNKLSFDYKSAKQHGTQHTIDLFQEGHNEHIDLRIWFDDLELYDAKYQSITLQNFIENGRRGWDGVYQRKDIGDTFGIYPIKNDKVNSE